MHSVIYKPNVVVHIHNPSLLVKFKGSTTKLQPQLFGLVWFEDDVLLWTCSPPASFF